MVPFLKMHFGGNDFVVLDARASPLPVSQARAAALADRRTSVGFDQLLILEPTEAGADVFLRILNTDGSEAGEGAKGYHDRLAAQGKSPSARLRRAQRP